MEQLVDLQELVLDELLIGIRYTAASINDHLGFSFTLDDRFVGHCSSHGRFSKKEITELVRLTSSQNPVERSVGIAVLNAVSQLLLADDKRRKNLDFLPPIIKDKPAKVGMIGNIRPIVKVLKREKILVKVLEKYNPPSKQERILAVESIKNLEDCDHLFVSGSAMTFPEWEKIVNTLLPLIEGERGLVGPSAGMYPDLFFDRRFTFLAGSSASNNCIEIWNIIKQGGGYDLFKHYCRKYTIFSKHSPLFG